MTGYGSTVCIYFIRPIGAEGPVKIGHSLYPTSRLIQYQCWSPVPLEIAATIELAVPDDERRRQYGMAVERRFHARYRDQWSHHEWFSASAQLSADIELIRKGEFDLSTLPDTGPPIRKGVDSLWQRGRNAPCQLVA